MKIQLEKNGIIKDVPIGFSWTVLFFGLWVPLIRGDLKWFIIMFVAAFFTMGFSNIIFSFIYNNLYIKDLLVNGWNPLNENTKSLLITNKIMLK